MAGLTLGSSQGTNDPAASSPCLQVQSSTATVGSWWALATLELWALPLTVCQDLAELGGWEWGWEGLGGHKWSRSSVNVL